MTVTERPEVGPGFETYQTPIRFMTAEEYLGIDWVPDEERSRLPEQMSAAELEIVLGNTNSELKCMILFALSGTEPKTGIQVFEELEKLGCFDIEDVSPDDVIAVMNRFTLGIVSKHPPPDPAASLRSHQAYSLTPFGEVVRSAAGQFLTLIGVEHNFKLENLIGSSQDIKPTLFDQPGGYGKTNRLALMLALIENPRGLKTGDIYSKHRQWETNRNLIKSHVDSLVRAKLITKEDAKGTTSKILRPTPALVKMGPTLKNIVVGLAARDPTSISLGHQLLDGISTYESVDMLIRRAWGPLDEERRPAVYEALTLALRILKPYPLHRLSTAEIYAKLVADGYGREKDYLSRLLCDSTRSFPNSGLQMERKPTSKTSKKWWYFDPTKCHPSAIA